MSESKKYAASESIQKLLTVHAVNSGSSASTTQKMQVFD